MANTANRLAGTCYLTVDGMDRIHGYSEKPNVPHIGGTIRDMGNLSVAALNAMTNVTVVAELANGKTIIGRNMWTVETQTAKSADATIDVKWEGLEVTEN
jgi:hypothetical protein